jgi:hypothetical protein
VRLTFVKFSSALVIIGSDRENKVVKVDFCKEKELQRVLSSLAIEEGAKLKDLYFVSPARPNKEISLDKTLLGNFQIFSFLFSRNSNSISNIGKFLKIDLNFEFLFQNKALCMKMFFY